MPPGSVLLSNRSTVSLLELFRFLQLERYNGSIVINFRMGRPQVVEYGRLPQVRIHDAGDWPGQLASALDKTATPGAG